MVALIPGIKLMTKILKKGSDFMNKKYNKGFTLIELLVVIAIIGLLSTLAIVALNNARQKSRDARRVSDIKQIQTALELYYNDANGYPSSIASGGAISYSGTTYMSVVPTAPLPIDGDCISTENTYTYISTASSTYTLSYCLGSITGGVDAGTNIASPAGIQ